MFIKREGVPDEKAEEDNRLDSTQKSEENYKDSSSNREPHIALSKNVSARDAIIHHSLERIAEISSRLSISTPLFSINMNRSAPVSAPREEVELRQEQIKLIDQLSKSGIDLILFDVMLSNELDRRLKRQFGVLFLLLTSFFSFLSYLVIILNGIYIWNISDVAITALIVETPIQFIGLLYIIARNLFPQTNSEKTNRDWLHAHFHAKNDKPGGD